jgi:hypothetical protein
LAYTPSTFAVKIKFTRKTGGNFMAKSLIRVQNNNKSTNVNIEVEDYLRKFYNSENYLVLPRSADCYFNWRSSQYNHITLNKKLQELGFLLANNFNLKECITTYKGERDTYTISSLSQTIIFYLMYIRYKDYYHFISDNLSTLSENKLIQLFLDELNLVYDPLEHDINCKFWSDSEVIEAAKAVEGKQSEKDKLIIVITSSWMFKPPKAEETEKK